MEPLPRALLEELAAAVARDGSSDLVEQVIADGFLSHHFSLSVLQVLDQYLSFIAPSPSLFSLLPPPSSASSSALPTSPTSTVPLPHSTYAILNSHSSTDQQIEDEVDRVATGLFSVVATMGTRYSTIHSLRNC